MVAAKHLVVDISAHGFGHVAQTAAVINCLQQPSDELKLTIRTGASNKKLLQERVNRPFDLVEAKLDAGMIMYDALSVDRERTMQWYMDFHSNYGNRRSEQAKFIEDLNADCVLSNIPYVSLDGASIAGVPNLGLCSLNWADVFWSYCQDLPGSYRIHQEIQQAYAGSNLFLQPTPSLPMLDLPNRRSIAPIARLGQRQKLNEVVGDDRSKFVLVGVGGVELKQISLENWPTIQNCFWIWPDSILKRAPTSRDDFLSQSMMEEHFAYIDLLASSDVVVTKTGYGTQTEAVVNQIPCICISRLDWPEHEYLRDWHLEHGHVVFCEAKDLNGVLFNSEYLSHSCWDKPSMVPNGAHEAADIISKEFLQ